MDNNKICIIGLGYIGLPSAAILANHGYNVLGVDIKQSVIDTINKGEIHIVEKGLEKFVNHAVNAKTLEASLKPQESDIFIIAVPTPFKNNYEPDIKYVEDAANNIAPYIRPGNLVILESTVPVGTTKKLKKIFENNNVNTEEIYIAHCPERVLPGNIMEELISNDRVVGGVNEESTYKAVEFYKNFVKGNVLSTDSNTAELAKLTENSFRDVNIAFANEISMICDQNNINVNELIQLANKHPRVNILQPGPGVGGHCIAVDPWFIVSQDQKNSKLIKKAREVNLHKEDWTLNKIISQANRLNQNIIIYGLSFKPNIDDLRESPALNISLKLLNKTKKDIFIVEPYVSKEKIEELGFNYINLETALDFEGFHVILVKHDIFCNYMEKISRKNYLDFVGLIN